MLFLQPKKNIEYIVLIKTSDKALISNDDTNVQFQFVGLKGQSQVFSLLSPYTNLFDHNQLDAFLIMSSVDLGQPEKIRFNSIFLLLLYSLDL